MKQKQLSILVATAIFAIGCSNNSPSKPTQQSVEKKPAKVEVKEKKRTGVKLSELNAQGVTKLSLSGSNSYNQGDNIEFSLDTKGEEGYLYLVYVDSLGNTGVLYPNPKSPSSEVNGIYTFPKDFGEMKITATKDCKDCEQDKTLIYALLSKEPILDIQGINKSQLSSIIGGDATNPNSAKSRGVIMVVDEKSSNSNLNVGVLEFFVK